VPQSSNVTPLIALDAVVLDCETTDLDPGKARVVSVAAWRIAGGLMQPAPVIDDLVNPRVPIPPATTRVHGLDDAAVAGAPPFAELWPRLAPLLAESIVIGHTIGYDLAVIKRECERAGLVFVKPRSLDTRLLAEVASPRLAGYSLDKLAAWLSIPVADRHSARGDVKLTADIFQGLVPKLRERNIRTLAEAEAACMKLTAALDDQHRAGWVEATAAPHRRDFETALGRIDSYPYRHRTGELMSRPPLTIDARATVADALKLMAQRRVSSLFVTPQALEPDKPLRAADLGIVTERDLLRVLADANPAAFARRLEDIASRPLATVPADAYVYRAIGRMSRMKIRHLGVVDDVGTLVGALSQRDLLKLRAEGAVTLGDEIDAAATVPALALAWEKLPRIAEALLREGIGARDVAAVISRELGALTRRACVLAEQRMAQAGQGAPPCAYAFAVLGSAGRGESLLAMDQDNALVFAQGEPDGPVDRWFAAFADHVATILDDAGVPLCKGGVMAKNPVWRGSVATWHQRIETWVAKARPEDLLSVDIFFDLRPVHGEAALAVDVWRQACTRAQEELGFAKLLAESAGTPESALTFLGAFRTEEGRLDIKKCGLFGIVAAARVLAVRHGIPARATPARLEALQAAGLGSANDLAALSDAQSVFLDVLLRQQIEDFHSGLPPTNKIVPKNLSSSEQSRLKQALQSMRHLETMTRELITMRRDA
jgi:DNA polymerase-3 subunit epsilon/CBS domain-containing protein